MVLMAVQEPKALKNQVSLCFISKGRGKENLLQNKQLKLSEQSPMDWIFLSSERIMLGGSRKYWDVQLLTEKKISFKRVGITEEEKNNLKSYDSE